MDNELEIGRRIKKSREKADLTQEELGNALGLNKSTIQRYETGKVARIKLPVLEAIAIELGVNPEYLALQTDDPIDYENSDENLNASSAVIEFCNGDAKKIYNFQKAAEQDACNEFYDNSGNLLHNFGVDYREESIITKYRQLDAHGKKVVDFVLNKEYQRCIEIQAPDDNLVTVATAARNGGEPTIETITQEQLEALKRAKSQAY